VPISMVVWSAWDAKGPPQDVQLVDFFAQSIDPDATSLGSGPHLLTATVRDWDVFLYAHRKAFDDHIHVIGKMPPLPSSAFELITLLGFLQLLVGPAV
jgi:hypothetical protein